MLRASSVAVPTVNLAALAQLMPGSCFHCDGSPAAKALRTTELVGNALRLHALAMLCAVTILALLDRRSASKREAGAYRLTTVVCVVSTLTTSVAFASAALVILRMTGHL